ncbi:aminotransferase class I/II-fold pyridoxal phosphate-dependent enzyme [Synechococcus sp. CBW1004]|uniref:aminotransferase class I/II-fold pyridoxal phosphate-dependent enzyme n=1 Tax=Synechococcus sp. CBW1004 TaxID=1353136 RepID=UPI0018CCF5E1|nr:aminotransferase class I/II-fold pyridoxal phosphate-dependent enzyme [Synechococcus sp. CBW1004]QPN63245.1 aminotransferase class I/II-fold pyridoxal phosphate-dependent enzyme [Synechococcus sp. CBW1004]
MSLQRASVEPARRLASVLEPVIPLVGTLTAAHPGTLSMAQGMVDWGPPPEVLAGLQEVLAAARTEAGAAAALDRYGPMQGDPELLEALASHLRNRHGLDLEGAALLVTAGSNMAFKTLMQVLCDPGDEVILPAPWYFNHVMAVQLAGGVPVLPDAGLIPDLPVLEAAITPRSRAIVTVSPNNPSGVVMPPERLAAINALCASRGLLHISDEAYAAFVHGTVPHWSPAAAAGAAAHTVTLQSFSKAYGMAGWRLGYAAVPQRLLPALAKVQDTNLICPPRLNQRAALAALAAGPTWLEPRLATIRHRRTQVLQTLAQAQDQGLPATLLREPDGAFYALLQVRTPLSGLELVERLIREHGVAALPGESFGLPATGGDAVLRLSYGLLAPDPLEEALQRLCGGVAALAG